VKFPLFLYQGCYASKFCITIGGPLPLLSMLIYVLTCIAYAAFFLHGEVFFLRVAYRLHIFVLFDIFLGVSFTFESCVVSICFAFCWFGG
jgi:hypothetical protein